MPEKPVSCRKRKKIQDAKRSSARLPKVLDRVPYHGARSFREALQSLWFVHMILHLEGPGPAYTIGRFDQFMYPYFRADLKDGKLTREEAQELIECLFLKINSNLWLCDSITAERAAGFLSGQTLCIGGSEPGGSRCL